MAATPEGRVKKRVRDLLKRYEGLYQYWPVPMGLGRTTLDCIGCFRGQFFAIETKRDGAEPTLRQEVVIKEIAAAGGDVFVVSGESEEALFRLKVWLDDVEKMP
jgi:hypothetical protein